MLFTQYIVSVLVFLSLLVVEMDSLPRFGVSKELSHEEFSRRLRCAKDLEIATLRLSLFEDAKANNLVHMNSQLVARRKVGGGKSVVEKHVEDIWLLVCSIKNKNCVPRVLLKNGKRSKEEFEHRQSQPNSNQAVNSASCSTSSYLADQSLTGTTSGSPTNLCHCTSNINQPASASDINDSRTPPAPANAPATYELSNSNSPSTNQGTLLTNANSPTNSNLPPSNSCRICDLTASNDSVFRSSVISDINLLKTNVSDLRRDVHQLRIDSQKPVPQVSNKSCFLYVRLNIYDLSTIGTSLLESVLSCHIQRYWIIGNHQRPVLKVEISESHQLAALTSGNQNGHHTSVWHKKDTPFNSNINPPQRSPFVSHNPCQSEPINILSWNSRGLTSSVPYIQSLLCEKPSVLVLSEHWLWLYELTRLNDISDDYEATGKADSRLTETSNGGRGFGGIAILWHKKVGAIPVSDITSDRICVILFL